MREDPFEALLKWGRRVPEPFGEWTPGRSFLAIRSRLNFTQEEVGLLAGITQSQVSRVEGDGDARISTWRRLYAAMGFELLLLPRGGRNRARDRGWGNDAPGP